MSLATQDRAAERLPPAADHVVRSQRLLTIDLLRRLFLFGPSDEVLGLALAAAEAPGGSPALADAVDALRIATEAGIDAGERWGIELAAEFARLIVGPAETPAVPYASFYLSPSRLVMTEETLAVRRQYFDAGVARGSDVRIPDDHIGLELDFLYFLEREVALAAAVGDHVAATAARARRANFIGGHLSQWVPRFVSNLRRATSDAFMHAAAAALLAVVSADDLNDHPV